MKKILLITLLVAFVLSSCQKETLNLSKVITYPMMTLTGDVAMTIPVGSSYIEKGCVVKEGQTDLSKLVKISGTVNSTTPGVYTITYTYKNAGKIYPLDSLTLKVRRYVGVVTPGAAAMDITGTYKRNAGAGGIATIVKTAYAGLYINDNPGGVVITSESDKVFMYMFQTDVAVIVAPSQKTNVGEFACTNGKYSSANKSYSWVCINGGYGTAVRTFIKQ